MLDIIRANSRSWGVKIAFGIIIIVFVFWGVGGLTGGPTTVALTVNGEPVSIQDFHRTLMQAEENLRLSYPDLDREQLRQMQLGRQVVQQLVLNAVLEQEARRTGIVVTPAELRRAVETIPAFRNDKGGFDPDLYLRRLEASGTTPGRFEAELGRELLVEKLRHDVTAGLSVPESEVRAVFNYDGERAALDYVLFAAESFKDKAVPAPEAVRARYDADLQAFRVPAAADVDYLVIGASTLAPLHAPDAETVRTYYEQNKARYTRPEQIRARHILIPLARDASEDEVRQAEASVADVQKRLAAGEDFAALAEQFSKDPGSASRGGDLGWFGRGMMVPEFEQAAFALKPGEISKPVRSAFGYHLIRLEEARPESVQPLAEVEADIRQQLGAEQAAGGVQEALDQVLLSVLSGKELAEAGAPYKLTVHNTGLKTAEELAALLGLKPEDASALTGMEPGAVTSTPFVIKDGYVTARVKSTRAEAVRPFEEVRPELEARLIEEKSRELAFEAASAARKALQDGTLPAELATGLQQGEPLSRHGDLGGLGRNPSLNRALFEAEPGQWLPEAYTVDAGAVLVRAGARSLPEDALWEQVKGPLTEAVRNAKREQVFAAFVNALMEKAEVLIRNERILEE